MHDALPVLGVALVLFSNLVVRNFYAEALFYALWRSFALFFSDLRLRSFVLICMFLRPTAFRTTAFGNCRVVLV